MPNATFRARARARLMARLDRPVLLAGSGVRDRNLPGYGLPWRQDSNVLYLVGDPGPGAWALIAPGGTTVFLPSRPASAALWEGEAPSHAQLAAQLGVDDVRPVEELAPRLSSMAPLSVAGPDPRVNRELTALLGRPFDFGSEPGDEELVDALIDLRRSKDPEEVDVMREAAAATVHAHQVVMRATRPGVSEARLHQLFTAALNARGCTEGYDTILTQRGEVLHNHAHDQVGAAGRLMLCDGGGEHRQTGYGVDVTRTWPVSSRFTPRQRAVYDAVLESHQAAVARLTPGTPYREVHLTAATVLARFLLDEGLLQGTSAEDAVVRGAHAVFFPHGVGHLLGLDVHDLEAFGDRAAYPVGGTRSPQFGLSNLRLDLPVEPGWVVTIEPGIYLVPSILADPNLRQSLGSLVAWERAEAWVGFGGVRIEDDLLVTSGAPESLTAGAPSDPEAIESIVGTGLRLEDIWDDLSP